MSIFVIEHNGKVEEACGIHFSERSAAQELNAYLNFSDDDEASFPPDPQNYRITEYVPVGELKEGK